MENNYQILLGSAHSKESTAQDNFLNIQLQSNQQLMEETDIQSTLDLNEQYLKERDTCTKYRLTVTINPVCTNVLCNPTSTIIDPQGSGKLYVNTEGSSEITKCIYDPLSTVINGVTPDFHIGYDIFDNVYFRTQSIRRGRFMDDTVSISTANKNGKEGEIQGEIQYAYIKDNINGYAQAITLNLVEENGWLQCVNPSRLMTWVKVADSEDPENIKYELEETSKIPYAKSGNCEKTDMFPDRKMLLFNTICEYNSQNRLINEENWSYFVSYPYKNEYFHPLVHTPITPPTTQDDNGMQATHGIPIVYASIIEVGDANGENIFDRRCIKITTAYSNKFKVFNTIRIYTGNTDYDFVIQKIVDDKTFFVLLNTNQNISFKKNARIRKIVNNIPCEYYIRVFRKLPNWKFEDEQITPHNIDNKLQTNKQLFSSTKYNLGYEKNYFNDKMVQISFTDSIDINLLKDNIGRPLTKIYLTIYKNNESNVKWEDYIKPKPNGKRKPFNPAMSSEDDPVYITDFQRYWSKNSSGFELVYLNEPGVITISDKNEYATNYPNIYCMHNINQHDKPATDKPNPLMFGITIPYNFKYRCTVNVGDDPDAKQPENKPFYFPYSPNSMEDNIEDRNKILYDGDICEFDKSNFTETVLSKCQYRFNTVNRESNLFHDTAIVTHAIAVFNTDTVLGVSEPANSAYNPLNGTETFQGDAFFGNVKPPTDCQKGNNGGCIWRGVIQAGPRPEGYYHQAHYPITLKWYENQIQYKSFAKLYLNPDIFNGTYTTETCYIESEGGEVELLPFFTYSAHQLIQNAIIKMMWEMDGIEYEKAFVVTPARQDDRKFLIPYDADLYRRITDAGMEHVDDKIAALSANMSKITVCRYDYDTPVWGRHIGFGRFAWRNVMSPDDAVANGNEEHPFTNGHLYVHKQINFFLRRQSIGCSDMLFKGFPADVSPSSFNVNSEVYEEINEIC